MSMENTIQNRTPKAHMWKGIWMILILWLAYVNFAMNWAAGSLLGQNITDFFFAGQTVSPVISQMINYTITIARIVANILAAQLIIKLGPKKAVYTGMTMLLFSLVAVWSPNYTLYILARMVMALGGSILVIYVNPVITKYIPQEKKVIAAGFNTLSYNFGVFVVSILFFFFGDALKADWRFTLTMFGSIAIILFIFWIKVGEEFDIKTPQTGQTEDPTATYGYVIKMPFIWVYTSTFIGFLILYILGMTSLPALLGKEIGLDAALFGILVSGGAMLGTPVGIILGRRQIRRKMILLVAGLGMMSTMALVFYLAYHNAIQLAYFTAFISGVFMFSQYPVFMNIPHEMKGFSAKKVTIIFGYLWAFTYFGYTIVTVIWSYVLGKYGFQTSIIFYLAAAIIFYSGFLFLPETLDREKAKAAA